MITEDYISFETAKLLKEKGFDEKCFHYYEDNRHHDENIKFSNWYNIEYSNSNIGRRFAAPTLQMAMKWLREVHNIDIVIDAAVGMLGVKVYVPLISTYKPLEDVSSKVRQIKRGIYYKDDKGVIPALQHFDSYEVACEAAIKYCFENLI